MSTRFRAIGAEMAEMETDSLPDCYIKTDVYLKARSFGQSREVFFVGRTGSGKSAILTMIRQEKRDKTRTLSIAGDEFGLELLGSSQEVSELPRGSRQLAFKALWKYVIIINILKTAYGRNSSTWLNLLYGNSKMAYDILAKFGELAVEQMTLTDQIFSFLRCIRELSFGPVGSIKFHKASGDSQQEQLFRIFKRLAEFQKNDLGPLLKGRFIHVLIDDLDRNWSGSEENKDLARALFETVIELSDAFHDSVRFVVALRTDIFRQLRFPQIEKIRPYIVEIQWGEEQLKQIVERRLETFWGRQSGDPSRAFPMRVGRQEFYQYLVERTLRRPRDIISFLNLMIQEANARRAKSFEYSIIRDAEKLYSRYRTEALVDEWNLVHPRIQRMIDGFAGISGTFGYDTIQRICESDDHNPKQMIDALYEVGFLGFRPERNAKVRFSFFSPRAPGYDHAYQVNLAFHSYLAEKAEELGRDPEP